MNKKMLVLISIIFALVLNMLFMPLKVNANTFDETPIEEIEETEEKQEPTEGKEQTEINAEKQEEKKEEEGITLEEPVEEPKEVPATEGEETLKVEEPKEVPTEVEEPAEAETVTEKVEEPTMGLKAAPASSDDEEPTTEGTEDEATSDDIHGGQVYDITKVKVIISKVDEEGKPLSGAVLQLYKNKVEGDPIAEWTSGEEGHIVELPDGNYILHEKEAPEGYDLAEDKVIIVNVEIAEVSAGAYFSQTPCSHYGGTELYYVEIAGTRHEVYCINQNWETPDANSIYDGQILDETSIRDYTKQTNPVAINSDDVREYILSTNNTGNNAPMDVSEPSLSDQELYDKLIDIIYHRLSFGGKIVEKDSNGNDVVYEYSEEEIRFITEVALKNYTNPGLAELQWNTEATEELIKIFDEKGVVYKRYKDNETFVEDKNGAYVSYLKHNYRDYEYNENAANNESIVNMVYGTGTSFGQMVASHWASKHGADTSGTAAALAARATVARYYKLFKLLISNDNPHPEDMNLYIYSSMSQPKKISGNDHEPNGKYQNLLGVTGYFEEIEQKTQEETLENKYSTEKTSATIKKVWDDNNNQDGKRPESITVKLSNGTTVTLNEANNWEATVKDLPKYDKNKLINYSWEEVNLPEGYKLTSVNVDGLITTMTNSYTPEVRNIKVNKVWYDEDNLYQVRAKEVKVDIIADGKVIKTITLNDANNWEETLEDLPVYANGKKIEYKVSEFEVEYYKVIIEEDKEGFTIYNYYDAKGGEEPPKTSDNISLSIMMLILSSGIFTTCVFVKKNSNI